MTPEEQLREELAELRELEARVYSRDASPTPGELTRLRELHGRRRAASVAKAAVAAPADVPDAEPPPPSVPEKTEEEDAASPPPSPPRPHRLRTALVGATTLLIGIACGLLIAPLLSSSSPLTAAQAQRQAEIFAAEGFDEDSLVLVGERDGINIWAATLQEGSLSCVVADSVDTHSIACRSTVQFRAGERIGVIHWPGGMAASRGIFVTLGRSISGEPLAQLDWLDW